MQVAKHAELIRGRRCDNVDVIGNCEWPTCGLADFVYTDILIASHESQLLRIGRRFEHTQIGDHHLRSRTSDGTPRALTVSVVIYGVLAMALLLTRRPAQASRPG